MTEKLDLTGQLFNLFTTGRLDSLFVLLASCTLSMGVADFFISDSNGVLSDKCLQRFPRGEEVKWRDILL